MNFSNTYYVGGETEPPLILPFFQLSAPEKRNHVWKAALGVLIPAALVAVAVAVVWILVKRGVIRKFLL